MTTPSLGEVPLGPMPLGLLPAHHAARLGADRVAVRLDDGTVEAVLTWGELEARANRRARALEARGVGPGDFVVVALRNGFEFYETSFGLWKLGAIPTMVSPALTAPELREIVALVSPRLVVGPDPARLPGHAVLPAGTPLPEDLSTDPLPARVSPYWKAVASGGSTGRPKVIVDRTPGLRDPLVGWRGQAPGDTVLNPGPLYHNAPFLSAHSALLVGGEVVEMVRFDAARALELIARHRVAWVNLVPTMMSRLWALPREVREAADLSSLRRVVHMAAACPVWLKRAWIDWLGPDRIEEVYAGTERIGATIIDGRDWLAHPGSVGRPAPGTRMIVVDAAGAPCPPDEVGEIYFLPDGGRGSTYFYVGAQPRALGEWETLGDLGHLDAEGYLYLADRRSDLIVSGGVNLYPAEIEGAVELCPGVIASVVVGLPDVDLGQRAHAIVQRAPGGGEPSEERLRAFLRDHLAPYKIPRSFEFGEAPLRDEAGKTRRSAFRAARLDAP